MNKMRDGSNAGLGLKKGVWTAEEDMLLKNYIEKHGEGKWHLVPLKTGLNRCRKSCRLRWLNYLRPDIKKGDFGADEVDLILRLHKLLGNRWALIAGRIPGRTANDVKNYWNTHFHSRSKRKKGPKDDGSLQTMVTVIKPQPQMLSKPVTSSSNDGANNNFNISNGLILTPNVVDGNIDGYLGDLLNERENDSGEKTGWSFDFSTGEEALTVVEQEDDQNSLFDFEMNDFMWDFLASNEL